MNADLVLLAHVVAKLAPIWVPCLLATLVFAVWEVRRGL
jgi:hypothetical protein